MVAKEDVPIGQRYDLVYLPREEATGDSPRLRKRLGALATELFRAFTPQLGRLLEQELGVDVPWAGVADQRDLEKFFLKTDLPIMLAAITICFRYASAYGNLRPKADRWLEFVRRAMQETNVGYRDQHFERHRVAVIAALSGARYAAVLDAIEEAHRAIEESPPDGKMGIRHTFEAAETLFKLVCNSTKVQRLGAGEIREHLSPIVARLYPAPIAKRSGQNADRRVRMGRRRASVPTWSKC
jgi:hypothetical protein